MLFSCLGPVLAKEMCGRLDGCCRQHLHKWSDVAWLHKQAAWKSWRDINSLFLNPAQPENPKSLLRHPTEVNRCKPEVVELQIMHHLCKERTKSNGKVETKNPTDLQRWLQLRNYVVDSTKSLCRYGPLWYVFHTSGYQCRVHTCYQNLGWICYHRVM